MTTAARPTWAPAKGGNEQRRKDGQDTQDELQKRNLREELEERERRHFSSKDKSYNDERGRRKESHLLLEGECTSLPDGQRGETEDRIVPRNVDADDSDVEVKSDDESDEDDDDEDDEAALILELEQIRKERAEEKLRKACGETKTPKRFINDTIRNDFHRKFLHKYMK
uniref:Uncharacterized protein n=1 Tax=Fagus sylvatica TaxID=28930 RepID=A0A2N9HXD5_FAGSY